MNGGWQFTMVHNFEVAIPTNGCKAAVIITNLCCYLFTAGKSALTVFFGERFLLRGAKINTRCAN